MKKICATPTHGFTYVEMVVSLAILSILIVAFSVVTQMTGVTSMRYKRNVQSNKFAQAVIEQLKVEARENYSSITSDQKGKTYKEITTSSEDIFDGMTAVREVKESSGCKKDWKK